jgi:fido (protein-threonine AMPylation protein)
MARIHKWQPITDYEVDPRTLTDGELGPLKRIWDREKRELTGEGSLDEFDRRLRREWSIETGIIENVYTLDRGVTNTLIERGIDAALIPHTASDRGNEFVARVIQDHYDALEGMFDFIKGDRALSTGYIKQLHAALLRNQNTYTVVDQFGTAFEKELPRGAYKDAPNSPTKPDGLLHEYCPPEHVASEMDRLVALHREHAVVKAPPEVEAAWLHHRFTQIHPFADGNGRVARAIATLVLIKAGWFPMIVKQERKSRYLDALESADGGDIRPFVSLIVEGQREALFLATEVSYEIRPVASPHDAILAVRDRLIQRGTLPHPEWLAAKTTADKVVGGATKRFEEVAGDLREELSGASGAFSFSVMDGFYRKSRYKALEETPQTAAGGYRTGLGLSLGEKTLIELSFHALGPKFRGIIAVVGYLIVNSAPILLGDAFQINYEESEEAALSRFSPWLDRIITQGLMEWRRTL